MEPRGAIVIVYRRGARGVEYLVMHRGHAGPEYEGDWAWGPPSGAREPGETVDACARRELLEETGLRLDCTFACLDESGWPVYVAEAPADCAVCLSDEHDRFEWLPRAEAAERTSPTVVRAQLLGAAARLETGSAADPWLDPGERARLAAAVLAALEAGVPGSRTELRGSLASGGGDAYSDVDVLWVVPDDALVRAVEAAPAVLAGVRPVESVRADPDLQRSARRRLLFVRFHHTPLFWRLDLEVRAASAAGDADGLDGPGPRGDDCSRTESALANAVAAVKAELRGDPTEATALLDRAFARVDQASAEDTTRDRVRALVDAVARADPSLTTLAARVRALAETYLS